MHTEGHKGTRGGKPEIEPEKMGETEETEETEIPERAAPSAGYAGYSGRDGKDGKTDGNRNGAQPQTDKTDGARPPKNNKPLRTHY